MVVLAGIFSLLVWVVAIVLALYALRKGGDDVRLWSIRSVPLATAFLQVLILSCLIFLILFGSAFGLAGPFAIPLWPAAGPYFLFQGFSMAPAFMALPVGLSIAGAIAAFRACSKVPVLRWLSGSISVLLFLMVLVVSGELWYHVKLKAAAARTQPDCLTAGSFTDAIGLVRQEHQTRLFAEAWKNGKNLGWSFSTQDFYEVPESGGFKTAPNTSWISLPYRPCDQTDRLGVTR